MLYLLDGNKVSEAWAGNIKEYGYNNIGQLMYESHWDNANIEWSTIEYTYDSRGNRISKNENGVTEQYTYDRVNRLTGISGGKNVSYTYDNNGNMLTKNKGVYENGNIVTNETSTYTYDAFNRLTGVTSGDNTISYLYNAEDRRIAKTVNGTTTNHIWDRDNIIYEADASKNELAKYYYGRRFAESVEGSETNRYGFDPHGSVSHINGTQIYDYDSFGNLRTNPQDISKHLYCGEYYDAETGFIYLRNRYYDPTIGRFITEDPIKDGLNWYVYCGNNPVNFVDPLGLKIVPLTEIAAERGLSVSWNGESGENWEVTVAGHSITLNYQHTDGDWHLKLDDFAQSGDVLSLHSADNKVYIDDSLFNCSINDGSWVEEIKFEWYVGAAVAGAKAPSLAKGIIASLTPSTPKIAEQIPKAERIGSALKADVYHRAASFANLQGGQAYTWINGDKTVSTLYQVAGELNGKKGIFEYLINSSNQITHQIFVPDGVVNGILQGAK